MRSLVPLIISLALGRSCAAHLASLGSHLPPSSSHSQDSEGESLESDLNPSFRLESESGSRPETEPTEPLSGWDTETEVDEDIQDEPSEVSQSEQGAQLEEELQPAQSVAEIHPTTISTEEQDGTAPEEEIRGSILHDSQVHMWATDGNSRLDVASAKDFVDEKQFPIKKMTTLVCYRTDPGFNHGMDKFEEIFRGLNDRWEVLQDPKQRDKGEAENVSFRRVYLSDTILSEWEPNTSEEGQALDWLKGFHEWKKLDRVAIGIHKEDANRAIFLGFQDDKTSRPAG